MYRIEIVLTVTLMESKENMIAFVGESGSVLLVPSWNLKGPRLRVFGLRTLAIIVSLRNLNFPIL